MRFLNGAMIVLWLLVVLVNLFIVARVAAEWILTAPILGDLTRPIIGDNPRLKLTGAMMALVAIVAITFVRKTARLLSRLRSRA